MAQYKKLFDLYGFYVRRNSIKLEIERRFLLVLPRKQKSLSFYRKALQFLVVSDIWVTSI